MNVKIPDTPTLEFLMELEEVMYQSTLERARDNKKPWPSEDVHPLTTRTVYDYIVKHRGGLK